MTTLWRHGSADRGQVCPWKAERVELSQGPLD